MFDAKFFGKRTHTAPLSWEKPSRRGKRVIMRGRQIPFQIPSEVPREDWIIIFRYVVPNQDPILEEPHEFRQNHFNPW